MSDIETSSSRGRMRKLTEAGYEMYNSNVDRYKTKLGRLWTVVEECVEVVDVCDLKDSEQVEKVKNNLIEAFENYIKVSREYVDYLHRVNIQSSHDEANLHQTVVETKTKSFNAALHCLETKESAPQVDSKSEISSRKSTDSRSSKSVSTVASQLSSVVARKRAKAEALKEQMKFAAKEAEMRRRKAEIETDLFLLKKEKEVAVAEAELSVLEKAGSVRSDVSVLFKTDKESEAHEKVARTLNYVNEQSNLKSQNIIMDCPVPELNVNAQPFVPQPKHHSPSIPARNTEPEPVLSEFTRFLLKKDLLLASLTPFNEKPESFPSWKASFTSVTSELHVTPAEEMDLLIKWLGPDSSKQAISIKIANSFQPDKGLKLLWDRLDERYGSPEMIESALKSKLQNFQRLTGQDSKRYYELLDILSEIEAVKVNEKYQSLLGYYDSSSGVIPIVNRLPYAVQEKWTTRAAKYKEENNVCFPPFTYFVQFIREMARVRNDPSFAHEKQKPATEQGKEKKTSKSQTYNRQTVASNKTKVSDEVKNEEKTESTSVCPLHKTKHSLNECRGFRKKPFLERKQILKDNHVCFRCCGSADHKSKNCKVDIQCSECGSSKHASAMHIEGGVSHGGENRENQNVEKKESQDVVLKCTQICGSGPFYSGKSCAKVVLVDVYVRNNPCHVIRTYAILDEQSNRSLIRPELLDQLLTENDFVEYSSSSCAGTVTSRGRTVAGCVVQSIDGKVKFDLPTLIECSQIPSVREEIPTPNVALHHPHLCSVAKDIPPLNQDCDILLLIGRDLTDVHHVLEQKVGPRNTPYAQKLPLGWVIVGETCLGKVHAGSVNVNKTHVLHNGRPSKFEPCTSILSVKEKTDTNRTEDSVLFLKTPDDDKIGQSSEDREFLDLMDSSFHRDPSGRWMAPLPFRATRTKLPNNRPQALKRAKLLHESLCKNPVKQKHFVNFMKGILDKGHAETAPSVQEGEECWYLPLFGVYHPKKPEQIRGVFDSSAKFQGLSLNDVLLTGPDLTNNLLGILLRFRREPVAVTADIEQMFYCFLVDETDRNFLRFFWYEDNNPDKRLTEYRMKVHVFGNSPSPAIATYGLRKVAERGEKCYGPDVKNFVENNFYVDDGLTSLENETETVSLMKRTQEALFVEGNLRLHKITSNRKEVLEAFPAEDLAKDLIDLNFESDYLPIQRSLGLSWDINADSFVFRVSREERPYTKRGILSVVNSLYDPLGFVTPVTITGKLLYRALVVESDDWDKPLPDDRRADWQSWQDSLQLLETLQIPRTYLPGSLQRVSRKELHIYSDASEVAIAAAAYLVTYTSKTVQHVGFVLGKAKVAPKSGHTIPRLELCAAVLATEIFDNISSELKIQFDEVKFYTDSKVVLGYINNRKRRFFVYVANRVTRILRSCTPSQWSYVPTHLNPVDVATRRYTEPYTISSRWLQGPITLEKRLNAVHDDFPLVDPDGDREIRPDVQTLQTCVSASVTIGIGIRRFEKFSTWKRLVTAIAVLKTFCRTFKQKTESNTRAVPDQSVAEKFILKNLQETVFKDEFECIQQNKPVSRNSSLRNLNPFVDDCGLIRVGGRLSKSRLDIGEKHPVIVPKNHHIATLLVRHYHVQVKHQGRHFTEGAIRAAGFWILGCKKMIGSVIHKCVKCKKLRGKQLTQVMSDLPEDRLTPSPPFTFVGVDVFGPWNVVARRTRGGVANSKRWAVLFTCLTCRAVHIEVVEDMSSSAFINAVRRFVAIRGNVKQFRSDRGTNFVGSVEGLRMNAVNVEDGPVSKLLQNEGTVWLFNPPHASHMGGVWERMIGVARRILDSLLSDVTEKYLTHDVLTTFMAEVSAVINSRPLVPVSSDPAAPEILSPAMLLTQKTNSVSKLTYETADFKTQWKRVQTLADRFWKRWRSEYLQTLQPRRKWQYKQPNLQVGDIVLLKDRTVCRNDWPVARVEKVFPSDDGLVRSCEICVVRNGKRTVYTRPVTELVLLVTDR